MKILRKWDDLEEFAGKIIAFQVGNSYYIKKLDLIDMGKNII